MKRFALIGGFWAVCFALLFLFYFISDFYVIVGSGPGSWKKSAPLSPPERFVLSCIGATAVTGAAALIGGLGFCIRAAVLRLRKARQG